MFLTTRVINYRKENQTLNLDARVLQAPCLEEEQSLYKHACLVHFTLNLFLCSI